MELRARRAAESQPLKATLFIRVCEAKGLKKVGIFQSPNPFAVVDFEGVVSSVRALSLPIVIAMNASPSHIRSSLDALFALLAD